MEIYSYFFYILLQCNMKCMATPKRINMVVVLIVVVTSAAVWRENKVPYQIVFLCYSQLFILSSALVISRVEMCQCHYLICRLPLYHNCSAFISLFSGCPIFFSPFPSCTHASWRVGVWGMTHLLHTSSLLAHIWAARKSILQCFCSGEEQAMRGERNRLFSLSLFSVLFFRS